MRSFGLVFWIGLAAAGCATDAGLTAGDAGKADPRDIPVDGSLMGISRTVDTDGDGIPDRTEGTADANQNGIPAHLDPDEPVNVGDAGPGVAEADGARPTPDAVVFGEATDPDCDLNGYWAARQLTVSEAELVGEQFASYWYFFALSQQGEQVTVVEHHDCGVLVKGNGAVTVELPRATLDTLVERNSQLGRRGSMRKEAGTCQFEMDRFWSVRGASESAYLPDGPFSTLTVEQTAAQIALPTKEAPDGAEDWNGADAAGAGVAWAISGIARGMRWSVQRGYTEWFTDPTRTIATSTNWTTLSTRVRFDGEENVLRSKPSRTLLEKTAESLVNHPDNMLELKFLGRDATAPDAERLLAITDRADRCLEIRKLLPHENP